jgi:hypothetical protein
MCYKINPVFLFLLVLSAVMTCPAYAQQVPDTSFRFANPHPAYRKGSGPVIFIDQAHHNMHTRTGGFFAFGKLLEQDGYWVQSLSVPIRNIEILKSCKILVIANALDSSNEERWILPTPSAFSAKEIAVIRQWVEGGGRLLLIADHMPFAGAATELGKAFGFEFLNGFAFTRQGVWPPSLFIREDKTLRESPVTQRTPDHKKIDTLATFTGSAFRSPDSAIPVLSFLKENWALLPDTAWQFNANTRKQSLEGFQQGAILSYGKGKVAVFGEAAMYTAQIVNGQMPVGFNSPDAPQNAQFLLNLIHWLDKNSAER